MGYDLMSFIDVISNHNSMSTQDHNKRNLLENRRYLRKNNTSAEVLLWTQKRSRQIEGVKFRRQFSIGPYILDFYSPEIRLCIELDGKDHFTSSGDRYDYKRTEFLKNEHNIVTIRFENKDIFNSLASVLEEIRRTIASIKNEKHL